MVSPVNQMSPVHGSGESSESGGSGESSESGGSGESVGESKL